jgi:hypothetical protein
MTTILKSRRTFLAVTKRYVLEEEDLESFNVSVYEGEGSGP